MYLECCEGDLDEDWFIKEKSRMTFHDFRENLSTQMMKYDPRHNKYKGDMFMRKSTKKSRKHMKPQRLDTYSDDNSDTSTDTEKGRKTYKKKI